MTLLGFSSRVIVEHVEEVEGQVQVAFQVVGLVEAEVPISTSISGVVQNKGLLMLVTGKEAIAALEVQTNDLTKLITNAKMSIPVEVLKRGNSAFEMIEVIPNAAVVVGQVAMVDGETSVSLDVPILFSRLSMFLAFLSHHAQRKSCDDEEHQQFRKSQIFLHNVIVLGL